MSAKRGATGLSGILLVDKPAQMTSHDVINRIRRLTGERRVGHAGTLDPMATGLLVVLVGPAARLGDHLTGANKRYEALIAFGSATDTDDAEGEVIATAEAPDTLFSRDAAQAVLDSFLGESMQMPPAYSAIKVGGQVAHRAARSGNALELDARPIKVNEARLIAVDVSARTWSVAFDVSKGTYIRSLARDIGNSVGSAAHLAGLRRTASGGLVLDDAHSLEEIAAAADAQGVSSLFLDPHDALGDVPAIVADAADVANGAPLDARDAGDAAKDARVAVYLTDGSLAGLYRKRGDKLVADTVFATPVAGGRTAAGARS